MVPKGCQFTIPYGLIGTLFEGPGIYIYITGGYSSRMYSKQHRVTWSLLDDSTCTMQPSRRNLKGFIKIRSYDFKSDPCTIYLVVKPTHLKNIFVKLDHETPGIRDWLQQKNIWVGHHRSEDLCMIYLDFWWKWNPKFDLHELRGYNVVYFLLQGPGTYWKKNSSHKVGSPKTML